MKTDGLRRLPPPPLFTIRPPPKPPGSLFENFQTVEILNGRCVKPSLNILNFSSSLPSTILQKHDESINWLNLFLLILAIISVICCIIIAVFIFICLKKLRQEEKQYKNYVMSGSLSSKTYHYRHHRIDTCTRTSEHYKCTSNTCNCCNDYCSHQLMPMTNIASHNIVESTEIPQFSSTRTTVDGQDTPQNHQYESIPDYLLTMTRRHHHPMICHRSHQLYPQTNNTCGIPYNTFSRSYLLPQGITTMNTSDSSQCTCSPPSSTTVAQEESSTPLLTSTTSKESQKRGETSSPKSMMIGWARRYPSSTTKRKLPEQRHRFLSQLRKSSIL